MEEQFYDCCGTSTQGEHGDDCPVAFNRTTWQLANERAINRFAYALAEQLEKLHNELV